MSQLLCAVPHCPCLKSEPTAVVCRRHFKQVPEADIEYLMFYVKLGDLRPYWRLWGATIRDLVKSDAEFLNRFKKSSQKITDTPAPLTGGVSCTPHTLPQQKKLCA